MKPSFWSIEPPVGVGVDEQGLAHQGTASKARLTAMVVRPGAPLGPQTAISGRGPAPRVGRGDVAVR